MVKPVLRRRSDPLIVRQIWNAINYIRQQKQISNTERILRYMTREYEADVEKVKVELQYAVDEDLIDSYTAVGFKGSKVGVEQEGFKVPDLESEFERGEHDWYCFICHKSEEVITCSDCWRVFHPDCVNDDISGPQYTCTICKLMRQKPRIKRKTLNRLLGYTVQRLKEKTRELHKLLNKKDEETYSRFVFMSMDLNTMEEKTKARKYKYLEQFLADAETVVHNVIICYGESDGMTDLAKVMLKDCQYDIEEVRQCKDCYYYSNAKPKDWFCQPCNPLHDLVYAKLKGFSYWPAKVIKVTEDGCDVRFFGGWHQRALLPTTSTKPIDANLKTLNIKKTSGFTKACEELKRHQALIEKHVNSALEEDDDDESLDEPQTPATPLPPKKKRRISKEKEEEEEEEEPEVQTPKKRRKFVKEKETPQAKERDTSEADRPPKKRKRQDRDERDSGTEIISSSSLHDRQAMTPEDTNLVTSSEDNLSAAPRTIHMLDVAVQTNRKAQGGGRMPHKGVQTDLEVASTNCNCEMRYNKIFSDFKQRMASDHSKEKDKALEELAAQLRKDFEEDKQQAVARAMANIQRETERARKQSEEKCKETYMEEMKKLAQKHKAEISSTKKKQWCYNCEEEAMYHCCWNTSYCSTNCQQSHWHREHKRMCRRKR